MIFERVNFRDTVAFSYGTTPGGEAGLFGSDEKASEGYNKSEANKAPGSEGEKLEDLGKKVKCCKKIQKMVVIKEMMDIQG